MRAAEADFLALRLNFGMTHPREMPENPDFVGRQTILNTIHSAFEKYRTVGQPRIGKSAIAVKYISQFRDSYKRVAYFQCPLADSIEHTLAPCMN
jgi:hypothetical protein